MCEAVMKIGQTVSGGREMTSLKITGASALLLLAACSGSDAPMHALPPAENACAPGAEALEFRGEVGTADAKTYLYQPFEVSADTRRVELSYQWTEKPGLPDTPLTTTTLDLGLYDQRGVRAGFRGWGGSRQGRLDRNQFPVFVQADAADRGFEPGPIQPGTWYAELGIAAVSPQGADWLLRVECRSVALAPAPTPDPVDRQHVARRQAGWVHGDFHMHAFHSQPNGPSWEDFISQSRTANLDFLMVTEYVTGRHWQTLGAVQRAHPDLLIVPGREIITYHGHVNTHGETPGLFEYRHGFEDVAIGEIQRRALELGALFQVSHPTIFPPPLFSNFCRGCYFELGDQIDWDQVDTLELVTGPVMVGPGDLGVPVPLPIGIANPFITTAINLWDRKLNEGHRITGVSGSDSKGVDHPDDRERVGYGSSATAVYVEELSRDALFEAIRAGRAYIRLRGVNNSPELEFTATAGDDTVMFGGTLDSARARLRTVVSNGVGQTLRYYANGNLQLAIPVLTDPFVHEMEVGQRLGAGPLGTYWRVETADLRSRTTIGNPIFLKAP
jgi:hypothetical protein